MAKSIEFLLCYRQSFPKIHSFRNDNQTKTFSLCAPLLNAFQQTPQIKALFRDKDKICASSQTGKSRYPAKMPPHHFYYHYLMVRLCSIPYFINCFHGGLDRGVKTDARLRSPNIIVNGFGY